MKINNKKKKIAFSLIEIVIVLITISLIASAFAPIISKKIRSGEVITENRGKKISTSCEHIDADCELCDLNENACMKCNKECNLPVHILNNKTCTCISCTDETYGDENCTETCAWNYQTSSVSCTKCTTGYYINEGSCVLCQSGHYCDGQVKEQCIPGYYSEAGASNCSKCPAGTYSEVAAGSCTPCLLNHYSAEGAGSCTPNTERIGCKTYSTTEDACAMCHDGYYGTGTCTRCEADYYCASNVKHACPTDYGSPAGSTSSAACTPKCPTLVKIGNLYWTVHDANTTCGPSGSCSNCNYAYLDGRKCCTQSAGRSLCSNIGMRLPHMSEIASAWSQIPNRPAYVMSNDCHKFKSNSNCHTHTAYCGHETGFNNWCDNYPSCDAFAVPVRCVKH